MNVGRWTILATLIGSLAACDSARQALPSHITEELIVPTKEADKLIPCNWEPSDPRVQKDLEAIWQATVAISGVKPKGPRPKVCGRRGAPVVVIDGAVGFLCGHYKPEDNTVLAIEDERVCASFECVLIHEFLHALIGRGHKKHPELMKAAGCKGA